jgi:alpha/beta superfamily hydrolase
MFKILLSFISILMIVSAQAGETSKLISKNLVITKSIPELEAIWKDAGIPKIIAPIKNGVNVYEVLYKTTYVDGSTVQASGVYFVPIEVKENLPIVVYFHGTQIEKERDIKIKGEMAICTGLAADGYAALYIDYMGIGKGEGFHIYQHAESQALAGLDMLIATEELNKELGYSFGNMLFTSGYSQGGHAAISFHRYIEEHPESGYKITASSPMSGAYDMAGAQSRAMFEPYSHPGYLPYLLAGYNIAYNIYPDLKDVFKSPWDTIIPPMLDGKHSMGDINKIMPKIPSQFVKDEIVEAFLQDENHPFRVALEANSFMDWKPENPIQLCYCKADEQVYYENALNTYKSMKSLGADHVKLRSAGRKFGHNTCALYAALYSKMYFDSIAKKGKENGKKGPAFKRFLVSISKISQRREVRQKKKEGEYKLRHAE